ncbi:MAG TPA: hypothetical protein VJR29_10630 [bacterium]|nr:hypothetical protein [bacterium]
MERPTLKLTLSLILAFLFMAVGPSYLMSCKWGMKGCADCCPKVRAETSVGATLDAACCVVSQKTIPAFVSAAKNAGDAFFAKNVGWVGRSGLEPPVAFLAAYPTVSSIPSYPHLPLFLSKNSLLI